jgi:tRNA dimethylallyltransferase
MAATLPDDLVAGLAGCEALLIAGPTASGKSALAIAVAEAVGGLVVNADSMQLYDGLRILTARPTPDEEAAVAHRLYGCIDPQRAFSVGDYLRLVAPVVAEARARAQTVILVGGTGLYFRALTVGLVETPEIAPEIMIEVQQLGDGPALHQWLKRHDPARAAELQPADVPRLQRAAALFLATGRSMKEWLAETPPPLLAPGRWQGLFIDPARGAHYARIDARFRAMMAEGALDEVRAILALGLPANRGVMKAHGLPHLAAHLRGEMSLEAAIALGQRDTRNYAKRQRTWARKFMADWRWLQV